MLFKKLCIDAYLLLSKCYYSQERYDEALNMLIKVNLTTNEIKLPTKITLRQKQLFAEGYSLKGLCLERQQQISVNRVKATTVAAATTSNANNLDIEILKCFEIASDLAIEHSQSITQLYHQLEEEHQQQQQQQLALQQQQQQLQTQQLTSSSSSQQQQINSQKLFSNLNLLIQQTDDGYDIMNPLYEIALQKAPILYVKLGDVTTGLKKFRELLLKRHIQSITTIRLCLLKKLSEFLLSSVCTSNYVTFNYSFKTEK